MMINCIGYADHSHVKSAPETNMFKAIDQMEGESRAYAALESKIEGANDKCVDAWFGQLCESDNNKFVNKVFSQTSIIAPGVVRTFFKDRENDKRWDLTHLDGFMPDYQPDKSLNLKSVGFEYTTSRDAFSFSLTDPESKNMMFDTTGRSLIFSDKYLELGMTVGSQTLFGLGQHNSKFLLNEGQWTMFNRDQPGSPEATGEGNQHLYGTHPFLMMKTKDNKFTAVLFYNSNPQQVSIEYVEGSNSKITYKTIGGLLDVYMFAADTADNVIRKYNEIVGKPSLPPFWALGFHQCSWQYNTTQDMQEVITQYQSNGYMFDTIWTDIMYMQDYADFTVDKNSHPNMKQFINMLHKIDLHFVPIVDAGISIKDTSIWYKKGIDDGIFVKTTQNPDKADGNLIAQVWPGYTAFVDFLNPQASAYWTSGLGALFEQMEFDGLWLDMNEPSNFCEDGDGNPIGECYPDSMPQEWSGVQRKLIKESRPQSPVEVGEFEDVPFVPGDKNLEYKTLSMDGFLSDPSDNGTFVMYNTHNMYGTLETKATQEYLTAKDTKRPLIISRDSFVGHGQYGSIWTGDNSATYNDMKLSINQVMSFNMFGMPFVGGDICGFSDDTTPELCARWAQVGAFYPFMRNHYAINKKPQEFYTFEDKFQTGMKESLRQRYSLLRYYYTQLYKSSAYGYPTVRHPMYEWPSLDKMVIDENSFMIGKAIRVTANFNDNDYDTFSAHFPKGRWLDLHEYKLITIKDDTEEVELYNGWDYTNVHVRGSSIVAVQDVGEEAQVTKTHDLLERKINLVVVPDEKGAADGELFVARGETTDEAFAYYTIKYQDKKFDFKQESSKGTVNEYDHNDVLSQIHVVDEGDILDSDFAYATNIDHSQIKLHIYKERADSGQSYLKIQAMGSDIKFSTLESITFGKDHE